MNGRAIIVAVALLALGASRADADLTTIDTVQYWDGVRGVEYFGETQSMGQTFLASGLDRVLETFTFYLGESDRDVPFKAIVMAWGGEWPIGDVLWESDPRVISAGSGLSSSRSPLAGFP